MIELLTSNFNPYSFVEIKIWESIFFIVNGIYFLENVIFEYPNTLFFKRMDFFIHDKLTFINWPLGIFIGKYLLNRGKIFSPVIHDWKIFLFIRKWNVLSKFLLIWFIFTSFIFLHFLTILLELYIVLCLFYLVNILLQTDFLQLRLVNI